MRIEIAKVVRALQLGEYAQEYVPAEVLVWVNPPRGMLREYFELLERTVAAQGELRELLGKGEFTTENTEKNKDKKDEEQSQAVKEALRELAGVGKEIVGWMAEVWSQGREAETHWTVEEVEALIAETNEGDPGLWPWLTGSTIAMIGAYRNERKKAWMPRS